MERHRREMAHRDRAAEMLTHGDLVVRHDPHIAVFFLGRDGGLGLHLGRSPVSWRYAPLRPVRSSTQPPGLR